MAKIIGQQESLNVSTVIYLANEKSANRPPLVWLFRTHLNCTNIYFTKADDTSTVASVALYTVVLTQARIFVVSHPLIHRQKLDNSKLRNYN